MKRLVLVLAALAVVVLPGTAEAQRAKRADLVVSKGTVRAGADGRLSGTFVVRNAGRRRAKATSASLVLRVAGKRRTIGRLSVPRLRRGAERTVRVRVAVPSGLTAGIYPLLACADGRGKLEERSERNNCRQVGRVVVAPATTPPPPAGPVSSVPAAPVPFTADTTAKLGSYWYSVPASYDASHNTPAQLLVWSHGCGGQSEYDVADVKATGTRGYITIALDGRENGCWDVNADPARILAAIADVKTHFNIDPRRIVLGGYSSGGDLSYRTAFYNSRIVSGVIAENTSPFRDTGSAQQASIAAASFKFPVVHLLHTEDDTYPPDGVRAELDALQAAGFPVTRVERPGLHYDEQTVPDLQNLGLSHMDDGWLSPGA